MFRDFPNQTPSGADPRPFYADQLAVLLNLTRQPGTFMQGRHDPAEVTGNTNYLANNFILRNDSNVRLYSLHFAIANHEIIIPQMGCIINNSRVDEPVFDLQNRIIPVINVCIGEVYGFRHSCFEHRIFAA